MRNYQIAASFDTETTNVSVGDGKWIAFPVLYIVHDLRYTSLARYTEDASRTIFRRRESEMLDLVARYIAWGREEDCVPVICAYNLLFDLQPIMYELRLRYQMRVSAQSSTHAYTVDLLGEDGKPLLRFWDTYYLEMRGLAAIYGGAREGCWGLGLFAHPHARYAAHR